MRATCLRDPHHFAPGTPPLSTVLLRFAFISNLSTDFVDELFFVKNRFDFIIK